MPLKPQTKYLIDKTRKEREHFADYDDAKVYRFLEYQGKVPEGGAWEEQSVIKPKKQQEIDSTNSNDVSWLGSMADWGIDENSYDFMKAAYNRSLGGTTEQLIYGKARYDVDESDFTFWEDVGATMVSFFMPLDLLTMGIGGRIGGVAAKSALKSGLFGGSLKKASQEAAKKVATGEAKDILTDTAVTKILTNNKLKNALLGGVKQAPTLGLYEAAMGGVQSKLNGESFFGGAAEGAFHGSLMGFFTGGIGAGMGAKQAEILSRGAQKDKFLSKMDKIKAYGVYGMPGQIGAEAGFFSAADLGMRAAKGEDLRAEDILHSFAHNVALFTGLKTIGKVQNKFWQKGEELLIETEKQRIKNQKDLEGHLATADATYQETTGRPSSEIAKEKSKITEVDIQSREDIARVRDNINKIIELQKSGDPKKLNGVEAARINDSLAELISRLEKAEKTPANEQLLKEAKADKEYLEKEFGNWLDSHDPKVIKKVDMSKFEEAPKETIVEAHGVEPPKTVPTPEAPKKTIIEVPDAKAPKEAPKTDKVLDKMSDKEIVKEGSKILNKPESEIVEAYTSKGFDNKTIVDQGGKPIINTSKLKKDIIAEKEKISEKELGPKLKTPEEHYKEKEKTAAFQQNEAVQEKVGATIEHMEKAGIKESNYKNFDKPLKESYYDIHDIGMNKFATESRLARKGDAAGKKEPIKPERDIGYLKIYEAFAKKLSKEGKSLREATESDITSFIIENPGSQNGLKILFQHLKDAGRLKDPTAIAFVPEIQKFAGIAEKTKKGLRTDRIDLENSEVRYVQSKTLGLKEVPILGKLKELFKRILGKTKETKEAGDTLFRDVNGNALIATSQKNLIKKYFGDINPSDLRKAFSQYVAKRYGLDSVQYKLVDEYGLGHVPAKLKKAYTKGMNMKDPLRELQKEFVEMIEGNQSLNFVEGNRTIDLQSPYKKGEGINIQQLRDGYNKLKAERRNLALNMKKLETKVGRTTVSMDTAEAMLRYMVETSPRPGETVPVSAKEVVFKPTVPVFEKDVQRRVEEFREKMDATRTEHESYKQHFEELPAYENIKYEFNKDLGKVKGKRILGELEGHVVRVSKGKTPQDVIPHEVSHYAVNVLKKFGGARAKDLIKRGIKMFGDEEALVTAIGKYSQGMIKNKSMLAKAKNWVKAFNAQLKDFFGLASKEDIAFIMSRKVTKGNIPNNIRVKNYVDKLKKDYMTAAEVPSEAGTIYGQIKKFESDLRKSRLMSQQEIDIARKKFDVYLEGEGKGLSSIGSLNNYAEYIHKIKTKGQNSNSRLEELRKEYNITKVESVEILKSLGSVDGNVKNLTAKNKQLYEDIITNYHTRTVKETTTTDNILGLDGKLTYIQKAARVILPAYEVLQKYGGPAGRAIKDRIMYFDSYKAQLNGIGHEGVKNMELLLGKKKFKAFKKNARVFDTERFQRYLDAFKEGGIGERQKWKKPSKEEMALYENSLKKGTQEYKAKKVWEDVRSFYWKHYEGNARRVNNKAEFEVFKKEFNELFVNDYFTRTLTKEAYDSLVGSDYIGNLVKANLDKAAMAAAGKKLGKGAKHEKIKELAEKYKKDKNFEQDIYQDIFNFLKQTKKEIKNPHIQKRGPVLPEYMVIKKNGQNKLIRTYEKSLDGTVSAYVEGMSKQIAALRYFPDFTGMGGKYKTGKTPADIVKLAGKDNFLMDYALKTVERLLGTEKIDATHKEGHQILGKIAHLSASTGLSSPTSGVKNILIGIPRSIASYGFRNTVRAIGKTLDADTWSEARRKGILDYEAKRLELGQKKVLPFVSMEKLFRYNWMTQTENFNRVVSMNAGKLYFASQVQALNGKGLLSNMGNKNAKRLMRDMWHLSEDHLSFLKKGNFEGAKNKQTYKEILRHVEQMSHLSAQGGTGVGRLPLWMSGKYAKPLTLFQRMAYSTTYDSVRNYYIPFIKHGNVAPIARAAIAHSISGAALYSLYSTLFDTEAPDSASSTAGKVKMYLWRSEFLGLMGEAISPYDKGMFQSLSEPVIIRNMTTLKDESLKWFYGEEFAGKVISNITKNTIVAFNQFDTMRKVKSSKEYSNARKVNSWERQYTRNIMKEGKTISSQDLWGKRTPYYRDLREAIYSGDDELIAKKLYATYNYIMDELARENANVGIRQSVRQKHKKAIRALKTSLKKLKFGNIFTDDSKGKTSSEQIKFRQWVLENFGEEGARSIRMTDSFYAKSMYRVNGIFSKYWDKYSAYSGVKNPNSKIN